MESLEFIPFRKRGLGASLPVYSWALGALASCLLFSPCVFSSLCTALMIRRVSSEHIRDGGTSLFGSKQNTYPPIGKAWKELCSGFNKIKQAHFGYNTVARAGKRVLSFLDQFSFCIRLTQEFQTTRCWGSTDRFSDYQVVEIQRRRIWDILWLSFSLCELVRVLSRVHGIYIPIFLKTWFLRRWSVTRLGGHLLVVLAPYCVSSGYHGKAGGHSANNKLLPNTWPWNQQFTSL